MRFSTAPNQHLSQQLEARFSLGHIHYTFNPENIHEVCIMTPTSWIMKIKFREWRWFSSWVWSWDLISWRSLRLFHTGQHQVENGEKLWAHPGWPLHSDTLSFPKLLLGRVGLCNKPTKHVFRVLARWQQEKTSVFDIFKKHRLM